MNDLDELLDMDLADGQLLAKQARDDLGRLSGNHPTGSFSEGGAGATPMSAPETDAALREAGVAATHSAAGVAGSGPMHYTSTPQSEVAAKLEAVGHRRVARAGYASGDQVPPQPPDKSVDDSRVEQNVFDRGKQRIVTHHSSQRSGTGIRGFTIDPQAAADSAPGTGAPEGGSDPNAGGSHGGGPTIGRGGGGVVTRGTGAPIGGGDPNAARCKRCGSSNVVGTTDAAGQGIQKCKDCGAEVRK